MGRKKRKQERRLKEQPKQTSEHNKLARELANFIATLPPRLHQQDKIIVDGKVGCIPSGQMFGYSYCKDCFAKEYCTKEVKWIVTNEVFEAR